MAHTLRDVFGWNRPFEKAILPAHILGLAERADTVVPSADRWTSAVRFSTLPSPTGELMFVHSAYPTITSDSSFSDPTAIASVLFGIRRYLDHRQSQKR